MRIIRELQPDIVMTWDPFAPYEGHPDHRAVATAANEAASFAHFPNFYPEHVAEGLSLHCVSEQWYFAKSPRDQNKFVDIDRYMDQKIEIDRLITHKLPLEKINDAFDLMHEGTSIRTVIEF